MYNLHPKGFPSSLQQPLQVSPSTPKIFKKGSGQKSYSGNHIEWEADSEETTRAVNRVRWHSLER